MFSDPSYKAIRKSNNATQVLILGQWRKGTLYHYGLMPPRYPVPAIREWFDWEHRLGSYRLGTDLFDEYVELVHYKQDRY